MRRLSIVFLLALATASMARADRAARHEGAPQPRTAPQVGPTCNDPQPASPGRYRGTGQYRGATPPATPSTAPALPWVPGATAVPASWDGVVLGGGAPPLVYGGWGGPVYVPVEVGPPVAPAPPPPVVVVVQQPAPPPPPPPPPAPPPLPPAPPPVGADQPGWVWLEVTPSDAVLVLDDEELGPAGTVADPDRPLELPAGVYVLKARHPQLGSARVMFAANATAATRVVIDLTATDPSRRTRVSSRSARLAGVGG